jgi:hypothetical protein
MSDGPKVASIRAYKGELAIEIELFSGQNSLGEPGLFAGKYLPFPELRGWPDYAITQWLVDRGWTYEYEE